MIDALRLHLRVLGALAVCGSFSSCSEAGDEAGGGAAAGAGGSSAAGSGGSAIDGGSTGGMSTGGVSTGGSGASPFGGSTSGGAGPGGAGGMPAGTPFVFVGSTDGFLRAFEMSSTDGSLTLRGELDTGDGLDFVALGPDDSTLFVSYDARVSAFAYDPVAETFALLDSATTAGSGTHVAVDPSGTQVLVAHYNQGALSLLNFSDSGGFGTAQTFSPGQNAHQVTIVGSGRHVYVPCLGDNHVAQYALDPSNGNLTPSSPATVPASGGPRHMEFHPSAPVAYVLGELASVIHVFDVDSTTGSLVPRPAGSVFTSPDQQYHWSSDIHVTPDGQYVYAVNRNPPEIVRFRVEADHALTRLGADPLTSVVRAFGVDPSGGFLQVGGEDGRLAALRVQRDTGALQEASAKSGLGSIHATIVR